MFVLPQRFSDRQQKSPNGYSGQSCWSLLEEVKKAARWSQ
jgi:hypothetical protein